ncbi:MAG TPA: SAF domain-containing protein [Solirubrobacterales bacterium]|jgi:Flp pilus assembly protein CpaB|nr:SAF domain-containing protein [Solirubrobacterales bacterium]
MSRRGRATAFAALAVVCGIASAGVASAYRDRVDEQLGETRPVLMLTRPLAAGSELRGRILDRLEVREVPVRFLPPDAIADPAEVAGRRLAGTVPAGSYLLGSQLRSPAARPDRGPRLKAALHPVDVTVSGAGALAGPGAARRVDVVVAAEPVTGGRAKVSVAARGVRLLAIAPAAPGEETAAGSDGWSATLALTRQQALELIEAENFAREIRLIPIR